RYAVDPPAVVRRRLTATLTGLVPPADVAEAVFTLEGVLAGPDGTREVARGAEVAREVLLALAAREPLVVAVDDLDRGTGELNRFLHRLFAAATARSLPLAVVALHRPEWADVLPGARDRRHRLDVPPLRPVETGRLLRHLLGRADRPAAEAARLLPLVDGNPGRAAAYVASLDAAPTALLPVPDAVRREVDARLDRLDGIRRAALTAVAALGVAAPGAGVTASSVARLLGWSPDRAVPQLRALAAAGLLVGRAGGGYTVADPVLREVAYARLPRAVRAAVARRAGQSSDAVAPAGRRAEVPVVDLRGRAADRGAPVEGDRAPAAAGAARPDRRERREWRSAWGLPRGTPAAA
ncbi:adenylyl cyclase class-3/4/guanylyl cyclase, partial [Micromonospora sp. NPDC000018]